MPTEKLEDSITILNPNKNNNSDITKYDSRGQIDNALTDENAAALTMVLFKDKVFRVKTDRHGKFYNPFEERFKQGYSLSAKDKLTQNPMFTFKTVSERSFNYYLKYLETGTETLLVIAERDK